MTKGQKIVGVYHSPTPEEQKAIDVIKAKGAELLDVIYENGKDNRRIAIAVTDIEKAIGIATKSIFVDKE